MDPHDKANLCLVCKQTRDIVNPLLYHTLELTLSPSITSAVLSSLIRRHDPGIQHVRRISVKPEATSSSVVDDIVSHLLKTLPQGCLRSLSLDHPFAPCETFLSLLEKVQYNIEHLHLAKFPDSLIFLDNEGGHLNKLRTSLRSLTCNATPDDGSPVTQAGVYAAILPHLTALCVDLSPVNVAADAKHPNERKVATARYFERLLPRQQGSVSTRSALAGVRRLHIKETCLGPATALVISKSFDVPRLGCLVLEQCIYIQPVLRALAGLHGLSLTTLVIQTEVSHDAEGIAAARTFNELLKSFTGLKTLALQTGGLGAHIVDADAVVHHGSTLRVLQLEFGDAEVGRRSHQGIAKIVEKCRLLRQLSLVSGPFNGRPSNPISELMRLDSGTGVLRSLAGLPELVTLHFRRWPEFKSFNHTLDEDEDEDEDITYVNPSDEGLQALTEEYMREYFTTSPLKVMAWDGGEKLDIVEGMVGPRPLARGRSSGKLHCFTRVEVMEMDGGRSSKAHPTKPAQLRYFEPEVEVLGLASKDVI